MKSPRTALLVWTLCVWCCIQYATPPVSGQEMPPALVNAKAQFYNFLRAIAQGQGITPEQNLILNSTIIPFDIAKDTPFYNDELFRQYADKTFSGGVEGLRPDSAAFLAARFSSQYRAVMNIAAAQIDRRHPEIQNSMDELKAQQQRATSALTAKLTQFEQEWSTIATSRGLTRDSVDYAMQQAAWLGQVRFGDQIQTYTDDLDGINGRIDSTRRGVYSPAEIATLDNLGNLSTAYHVARPWTANVERSFARGGTPLTELFLADQRRLVPSMFDSSPLVFPIGDLTAFLTNVGTRNFSTSSASSNLSVSERSWTASGGGSFLGFSLGGGGGGASSITQSMSQLSSLDVGFENIAEYFIDRSAWFNPGVLQDPTIRQLVKTRPELDKLRYVSVSLIVARGTKLVLTFSNSVTATDWSKSSFSASGGASFLGFSFGASGGSSSSEYEVSTSNNATTVTIKDGSNVARVLGIRVEPFIRAETPARPLTLLQVLETSPTLKQDADSFQQGKQSYLEFQKKKVEAIERAKRP